MVLRDGFEPTTCCFNGLLLYQLSYRNIEAARETRGRKMHVKPWEEGDSFRRLRRSVCLYGFADDIIESLFHGVCTYRIHTQSNTKKCVIFMRFRQNCKKALLPRSPQGLQTRL